MRGCAGDLELLCKLFPESRYGGENTIKDEEEWILVLKVDEVQALWPAQPASAYGVPPAS